MVCFLHIRADRQVLSLLDMYKEMVRGMLPRPWPGRECYPRGLAPCSKLASLLTSPTTFRAGHTCGWHPQLTLTHTMNQDDGTLPSAYSPLTHLSCRCSHHYSTDSYSSLRVTVLCCCFLHCHHAPISLHDCTPPSLAITSPLFYHLNTPSLTSPIACG